MCIDSSSYFELKKLMMMKGKHDSMPPKQVQANSMAHIFRSFMKAESVSEEEITNCKIWQMVNEEDDDGEVVKKRQLCIGHREDLICMEPRGSTPLLEHL